MSDHILGWNLRKKLVQWAKELKSEKAQVNIYKLSWAIALILITIAVLRYVMLPHGDMYQCIWIWEAVGSSQHITPVDE